MRRGLLILLVLLCLAPWTAEAAQTFYKSITLEESESGTVDSTNWPLTFLGDSFLADTANGGKCVVGNSGNDIRFYEDSALTTPLSFERVIWTNTTGVGEFHVRIPTLSTSTDTVLYVACGDTALTTNVSSTGTWNAAFQNVYHLGNASALILTDSTSNARTLTNNGTTFTATGRVGGAAAFVGASSQYLVTGAHTNGTTTVTMEGWAYSTNFDQTGAIVNKNTVVAGFELFFNSDEAFYIRGSGFTSPIIFAQPSNSNFHYMVGTITGTTGRLYLDGAQVDTGTIDALIDGSHVLNVGRFGDASYYFTGTLDEVRISNVERSPSWITATYNNQKASSTFTTLGTLTAVSGGASLVLPPAASSPHWPHITTFDYARLLYLNAPGATDYEWYADHLDVIEVHGNGATARGYNAGIGEFSYWADMSDLITGDFSGLAETGFLHFSENTEMTFKALDGSTVVGSASITGCPGAINAGCRVRTYIWFDERYIFYPADSAFRTWQSARLLGSTNFYGVDVDTSALVWLDEHAPGLSWPLSFGYQGVITSGGAVKEYGDRKPYFLGTQDSSFETDYGQALADWHAVLRTDATTASKKVLINSGPELFNTAFNSTLLAQANAIGGFATESKHRPDGFATPTIYAQWVTQTQAVVATGGIVDLSTTWCNSGPSGYTAGNYTSAAARFRMWRLASYYQFKEPVGSSGKVYFNTGFCSNSNPFAGGNVAADQANWALAYQVDVGLPQGITASYQTGTALCAYTVYRRVYTKALIFVRPRDSDACTTYDDTSGATLTFTDPVQLLLEDGTVSAPITSATIRNAESVIVLTPTPPPDIEPPSTPTNLQLLLASMNSLAFWWAPAGTDNFSVDFTILERGLGSSCTNLAEVWRGEELTYRNTGLPASTTYCYRIVHVDTTGNPGEYSPTVIATTSPPRTVATTRAPRVVTP